MSYARAFLADGPRSENRMADHRIPATYRLARFNSFETGLRPFHHETIAKMAGQIAASHQGAAPIRCVRLVGHAATWRNMKTEDYFRNAMGRAYAVAQELTRQLAAKGVAARTMSEDILKLDSGGQRCKPQKGIAVALYVGSRGNKRPVLPNLTHRSDSAARANRAENRCVDVTLFRAQTTPPKPPAKKKKTFYIYKRGDTTPFVEKMIRQSVKASKLARKRMNALAAMPEAKREAAWNAGAEAIWFGTYSGGGKQARFRLVHRFIDRVYHILRGTGAPPSSSRPHRRRVLTVESFRCDRPQRKTCRSLKTLKPPFHLPPVERWIRAAGQSGNRATNKLKSENRTIDTRHMCCREQGTMGLAFRSLGVDMDRPLRNASEPPPHKIALGPGFFKEPRTKRRKGLWKAARRNTIIHEVAHLAGVSKLAFDPVSETQKNDEVYGARLVKRLARKKPRLARVNAENYAFYIMSFAT